MWKAPNRPRHEISQSFNDGCVVIYEVLDAARPGCRPQPQLVQKYRLRFSDRRLGINRIYMSKQVQQEVERVIRVPKVGDIDARDVAVIGGRQYKIATIQTVQDAYPPCLDVALIRLEQKYEVMV